MINYMDIALTPDEQKLVEYSKEAVIAYNTMRHERGGIDTLYSFVMSDGGKIYDGVCFEPNIAQATVCGERHAIQNMVLKESYKAKIETIVVADPVPEVQGSSTPPCGTCRHLIWQFGNPNATVILLQYIQEKKGWIFPKMEKYTIKELYPHPYEPVEGLWDGWEPK
jgi:cytidine deaminase